MSATVSVICLAYNHEKYIEKAHGRDLETHIWTVNDKKYMKKLVKAGADAIITNYPDIAIGVVKKI